MTTPNNNNNNSQMHNDIMAAGLKDHPPMLATRRYAQWQSRFIRYVNTKPNMEELKKCVFNGPYVMKRVLVLAKPATEIDPTIPEYTIQETYENTLLENHAYIDAEAEAIHMILSGIRDEIYTIVDACKTAQEIKFTSRDGESIESYYSRFYKIMNEIPRNQLEVATMQVNVQFLQQLQPKWSRFVTVFKQTIDLVFYREEYSTYFQLLYEDLQTYQQQPQNLIKIQKQERSSTLRTENDKQTVQFGNQKIVTVAGARETVGVQEIKTGKKLFLPQGEDDVVQEGRTVRKIQEVLYITNDNSGPTYDTEPLRHTSKRGLDRICIRRRDVIKYIAQDQVNDHYMDV
ncbi:hypothetical protein Tco_1255535 [Tanacetum coccineum]